MSDTEPYKWAISGLCGFILLLIAWIKALLKEIKAVNAARVLDLKEQANKIRQRGYQIEDPDQDRLE